MKKTFGLIFLFAVSLFFCHIAAAQENIAADLQADCLTVAVPYGTMVYCDGSMFLDGTPLTYEEMAEFMPADLYELGLKGIKMRNQGKKLIISGSIVAWTGIALYVAGRTLKVLYRPEKPFVSTGIYGGGTVCLVAGISCLSAGVPLFCIGKSRAMDAAASYNMLPRTRQLTLNVGAANNGFGLYLNF